MLVTIILLVIILLVTIKTTVLGGRGTVNVSDTRVSWRRINGQEVVSVTALLLVIILGTVTRSRRVIVTTIRRTISQDWSSPKAGFLATKLFSETTTLLLQVVKDIALNHVLPVTRKSGMINDGVTLLLEFAMLGLEVGKSKAYVAELTSQLLTKRQLDCITSVVEDLLVVEDLSAVEDVLVVKGGDTHACGKKIVRATIKRGRRGKLENF